MAFLTASLLATEVGRIPSAEGIKAADENFINVYQTDTDQALFFDRLRKHELQKLSRDQRVRLRHGKLLWTPPFERRSVNLSVTDRASATIQFASSPLPALKNLSDDGAKGGEKKCEKHT
jgi:hypothetical protein